MQFVTSMAILASEHEETGGSSLIFPETSELIAGIIAFGIVFFFVWRWALPVIKRTLEQRQAAIKGQMEEAERAKTEAESLLADYKAQLDQAKAEGNRVVDDAREAAEQMKADIVSRAESEADQIRSKARDDALAEKTRALTDARSQVGDISVDLAGRIVGESLDAEAHQELIDRYLADLEKL